MGTKTNERGLQERNVSPEPPRAEANDEPPPKPLGRQRNQLSVRFHAVDGDEEETAVTPQLRARPSMRHFKRDSTRFASKRHSSKSVLVVSFTT